jgi:hypothetical protein
MSCDKTSMEIALKETSMPEINAHELQTADL